MTEQPKPIRILLVDDHTLFRESLGRFLASQTAFQIAGDCGSIDQALDMLRKQHVDIVLLDFELGGRERNGGDFMLLARQHGFHGRVLIVTAGVNDVQAAELIRAGVAGIFLKDKSTALLAQGIRDVMNDKAWFDQALLHRAVQHGTVSTPPGGPDRFTRREREVLALVLEGLANKQIAARLGVSESAIKATLQQVFSKTGVRTRSQLVRIILEQYPHFASATRE